MYSTVKSIAVASVIVVVSIQPGADAARAPYAVDVERVNPQLAGPMFNPYADPMAGAFQPGDLSAEAAPNMFVPEPPVAMLAPEPVTPFELRQYPAIERFDVTPAPEQAVVEPPKAPDVASPEVAAREPVAPAVTPPALPEVAALEPVAPVITPPPAASLTPSPVVSIPLPMPAPPREAMIVPAPAPKIMPRESTPREFTSREPARRTARPAAHTHLIAFDAPAGAPFAHTRFCLKYPEECRVQKQTIQFRGPVELTPERRQELTRINSNVNRSIIPTLMNETVATEQWVIAPSNGDCNDYAVTKRHDLIAAGWPARSLLLAEVIIPDGEHHLVVVVRTSQGDLVLDNLNANIRDWTKTPYQWVRIESPVNPMFWSRLKSQPNVVAMNGGRRL